ncbi:Rrf2 family transcriptional regulator [Phyllobacterium sp. 21LDTY02-6]|jgi:DNA-binding IscR family transcriptional regulator|uniref:Rrf2 family transcriptional regulator n=1 Tax=unclassified Phyllobacterium TaxID=2638441 RepID=UPI002020B33C|nr:MULTISPECIES: Rrf2 family transcriptional regulator [unclassified Phyllobacterium]MCO4317843.1 Rrf2 family transcriptional regulator [Phyllobacterium sp. 21LDTY02-6]MCX8282026.1 Rrf2 family transcriptional regulator [Phyllobacterium sp. 0TCS1.6C]MCX8296282.1 Rrf2 family transcriptional regulator [Phyllobacterium sp. 0TCS1.6A]
MKRNSRLSAILHVILHMAERGKAMTSEELALCMQTNAVVVRRTMAGLREAGFVTSQKGHGGGWVIARDLRDITLRDMYDAVGAPEMFALGNRTETPQCLVEQAVNQALDGAFAEAEALIIERLGSVSLADLAADFHRRFAAHAQHGNSHHAT